MIKIAIVDDHKPLIDGLRLIIGQEADIEVAIVAYDGQQILDRLQDTAVDVVVLDINIPVMDGITACKHICERFPQIRVLAMTSYDRGAFVQQMLKVGASGYVLKNAAADEIITAIRKVHAGETYLSAEAQTTLGSTLRSEQEQSLIPRLTRREQEILQLIAAERTNEEIASRLQLSEISIETHRRTLLAKLDVRNVERLLEVAQQHGLIS